MSLKYVVSTLNELLLITSYEALELYALASMSTNIMRPDTGYEHNNGQKNKIYFQLIYIHIYNISI